MAFGEEIINITVRDIMNSPPIYVTPDTTLIEVANVMNENNIGYILVVNGQNKPIGVITAEILVKEAICKRIDPELTRVKEIPYEPFITVKADTRVTDLVKLLSRKKSRLIGITYKGKLVGTVEILDIMRIIPDIIESYIDKLSFEREPPIKVNSYVMGYCDRCGAWSEKLIHVDGNYYCPDCQVDLFGEEK
jgi:predicted transcriptional regulator